MHVCGQADESVGNAVRCNRDTAEVCIFSDPLCFGYAADVQRVRSNDTHRSLLEKLLETLPQVDLLAGVYRRRRATSDLAVQVR